MLPGIARMNFMYNGSCYKYTNTNGFPVEEK